tara:strand:- start:684 stop:998 length:315 start_codon:yes stop_codon:yes gene_type:complete
MAKIKVKYTYKLSDRQTESVQTLKNRNYNSVVAKAKTYNKDINNDIYISEITNLDAEPRHTTCLGYTPKDTKANDFNLRAKDFKYSQLGNDAFNCVYLIPVEEF